MRAENSVTVEHQPSLPLWANLLTLQVKVSCNPNSLPQVASALHPDPLDSSFLLLGDTGFPCCSPPLLARVLEVGCRSVLPNARFLPIYLPDGLKGAKHDFLPASAPQ